MRSRLATTALNNELMVVCGGGGYLPVGVMVGGDNYLTTELRRGRDNGAIRFFLCMCV